MSQTTAEFVKIFGGGTTAEDRYITKIVPQNSEVQEISWKQKLGSKHLEILEQFPGITTSIYHILKFH